jgi:type I restriction enzyme S subunit
MSRNDVGRQSKRTVNCRSDVQHSPELPGNWHVLSVGEMFSRRTERGRPGLPVMSITMTGGLVERNSVDRRVESSLTPEGHLLVRNGDLTYNMMRMWQGVLGRGRFECLVSPAYVVLQPNEKVNSEFAEYLFSSRNAIAQFKRLSYGVVDDRLRLYFRDLVRLPFAVPRSYVEQARIATILAALDDTIQQTEALLKKYQHIRSGLMHDLFTRGLTPNGRLRPLRTEAPQFYCESPLGWIPKEWAVSSCAAEFSISSGITLGPHRRPRKHCHPYLRVGNVFRDKIVLSDLAYLEVLPGEVEANGLKTFDLLVVEGHASRNEIGRCAMVYKDAEGLVFQNHLFRLRPIGISSRYALHWLNSHHTKRYWEISCATSSGLNTINRRMLGRMPICVAPPDEQALIVGAIEAHRETERADEIYLSKLRIQKLGLMHDLLNGSVRVERLPT